VQIILPDSPAQAAAKTAQLMPEKIE